MRPTVKLRSIEPLAKAASEPVSDVSGLVGRHEQVTRALAQTRAMMASGELEKAGDAALKEVETAFAGMPDPGPEGILTVRVVAVGDAEKGVPAVPLSGVTVRLRVNERVVREVVTNPGGLASLEVPEEARKSYELETLGPDCSVLVCQPGQLDPKRPSPVHLVELTRIAALKPHLERARPLEDALKQARRRADLARSVASSSLKEQESRLVSYLAEIEADLECADAGKGAPAPEPTKPVAPEPTKPVAPEPTKPDPKEPTKPEPKQPTKPDPKGPTRPDPKEPTKPVVAPKGALKARPGGRKRNGAAPPVANRNEKRWR